MLCQDPLHTSFPIHGLLDILKKVNVLSQEQYLIKLLASSQLDTLLATEDFKQWGCSMLAFCLIFTQNIMADLCC